MELEKQMPGKPLFAGPFRNDGTQSRLCSPGSAEFTPLSPYSSQVPLVTALFQEQALYLNSSFFFFFAPHSMWDLNFSDQGWNPYPLQWKPGVLTTRPPGNSLGLNSFRQLWGRSKFLSLLFPKNKQPRLILRPKRYILGEGAHFASLQLSGIWRLSHAQL